MSSDPIGDRTDEEWERIQERERIQALISEVARLRKEVEELRKMIEEKEGGNDLRYEDQVKF